jgi:hypothetical protein
MTWASISQSSWTVRAFRAARSGSVAVKVLDQVAKRVPILGYDIQRDTACDEHRELVEFERSRIVRALVALLMFVDRALSHSKTAKSVSAVRSRFMAFNLSHRVRLIALTIFSALVVHLLLTRFRAPEPTVAVYVFWTGALILIIAAIVEADALAAAWTDRSSARTARNESDQG